MTLQIDRLEAEMRMAMDIDDWERVESLAAQMDLLDIHKPPPPLPNVALWYAEQGLHVFPLEPKGKRPYPGSHGCKEATADLDQVRAWWSARPEANIGIATG
ncbi:MAG: bifunctional DNA primase/polymerase, partial [Nocardioidaceae bacterium]